MRGLRHRYWRYRVAQHSSDDLKFGAQDFITAEAIVFSVLRSPLAQSFRPIAVKPFGRAGGAV
jgi:hypothetical protein